MNKALSLLTYVLLLFTFFNSKGAPRKTHIAGKTISTLTSGTPIIRTFLPESNHDFFYPDDNKFEYDFSGALDNSLFTSTGFSQSSPGSELRLTAVQSGWQSQFLSNESFERRDGLTFKGSVFIPYGGYKAVMIGFHDGINNGTEGIAHGLYFFENGSAAGVEIAARHGSSASPMPVYKYKNPSSPGSWFDYKIVLHPAGATYYVKRDTESTYTNVLTFDGGIDLRELKLGIQATTGSYTTNYTAHKNWKVYQSEVTPNANGIIYVKASGAGTSTGDSWANAAAELSDALKAAKILNSTAPLTVKEIWVAGGTYKPRYSPEDGADFGTDQGRNNAFLLVKDVKIYGGFAGTETALANRNLSSAANRTTLSGDFNDDDVITGSGSTLSITGNSENAYQVVISTGNVGAAVLDGFTISGGNADGSGNVTVNSVTFNQNAGGGMFNRSSSPELANVSIKENKAFYGGGGIYNSSSSPKMTNVFISRNKAGKYGGGVFNSSSSPVLTNVIIDGNQAVHSGGMCNLDNSSLVLTNVTIVGNSASSYGAMYNLNCSPQIRNTIIWDNSSGVTNSSSSPAIFYSLVQGSAPNAANHVLDGTISYTSLFNDAANGDYTLKKGSPAINTGSNTYFETGQSPDLSAITKDIAGNPRIFNTTIDLGAYEWFDNLAPVVTKRSGKFTKAVSTIISEDHLQSTDNASGSTNIHYTITALPVSGVLSLNDTELDVNDVFTQQDIADAKLAYKNTNLTALSDQFKFKVKDEFGNETSERVFSITLAYVIPQPDAGGIIYVKESGAGNFSGSSWANAAPELADALKAAKAANDAAAATVKEIWVAGGTYKPIYRADNQAGPSLSNRDNAFVLVKDVKIYGGFAGTETALDDRDLRITANQSILSGDFNDDDSITGSGSTLSITGNTENAHHVVISAGDAGAALLDGFSITGGNAAGSSGSITVNSAAISRTYGGGMYNSSSLVLKNVTISGNNASYGGGMYNHSSSPVLTNITLDRNQAGYGGGLYTAASSSPVLTNVTLNGNKAAAFGGGIYSLNSSGILTNAVLTGNSAQYGGGMFINASSPVITNVTIAGNTVTGGGGGIIQFSSSSKFRNSIIWGNTGRGSIDNINGSGGTPTYSYSLVQGSSSDSWNTYFGTDGGHNIDVDPLFTDAANGDYTLKEGSPLINAGNSTLFAAGETPDLSAITTDLAGNPRIIADNVDIGAYERQKKQYVITFSGLEDGKVTAVYGASEFSPASAVPEATISYSLPADNGVAEIVDGKVKVISAGEVELTASIAENDDYKALSVSKILKITKAPLIITAKDSSKVYDGTAFSGGNGVTYSGFVNSEEESVLSGTLSYAGTSQSAKNAGNYVITPKGLTSDNYEITFADGALNITRTPLTVTAKDSTKVYDGTAFGGGNDVVYSGFVNSEDESVLSGTLTYAGTSQGAKDADIYAITPKGLTAANYEITFADGSLTITKAPLTITAKDSTKVYDGTAFGGGNNVVYDGFVNSEDESVLSGTLSYSGTSQAVKDAGSYIITPKGLTSNNYEITFADGTLTITKAPLTITAKDGTKVYDSQAYTGGNGVTYSGFVNSEEESVLGGTLTYAGTAQNAKNAGDYIITPKGLTSDNYEITFADGSLTITKAPLTITAKDSTKVYDGTAFGGGNNVVYDGFVNSEDKSVLSGTLSYAGTSQGVKDAGSYIITPQGLTSDNYEITFADGTLNITKAPLTITAKDSTKVYDGLAHTGGNGVLYSGFVNSENDSVLSGTLSYAGTSQGVKDADVYAITPQGLTSANYEITFAEGTLEITKAPLTITAKDSTKVYDGLAHTGGNGVSYTGFVNSEDESILSGTLSYAGTSQAVKDAGSYIITPQGLTSDNYEITFADGSLTITKASLTITAKDSTKVYDGQVHTGGNGVTYSGFVNSEDESVLSGTLSYAGTSQGVKDAGSYIITPQGLTSDNYEITFADGSLNISEKPVIVTADAKSKTYGDEDPELSFQITSGNLENGDSFSGSLSRTIGESAGTYTVNRGALTLSSNYTLSFVPAEFTINPAPLVITADNKTKFAGTANPELTVSYDGFVNGEDERVLSAQPAVSTAAVTDSPLGDYPITAVGASAANYTVSYVPGILKVVPGAPKSVSLASAVLYENTPSGTPAGTLSSASDDPNAVFSYTLAPGAGDTDNSLFSITGSELRTASVLNYEHKSSYSIRVRSATQHGFWLEEIFTIHIQDVNEIPTLDAIGDQTICYTASQQEIPLSGISAGEDAGQTAALSVSADNAELFEALSISGTELRYRIKNGASGTAQITVTVQDNGGTAGGGTDTFSRSFTLTVNPLPAAGITSDIGTEISKGAEARLTASGGVSYQWSNASGIISGQNSAVLTVRPAETTAYRVTVTNAGGCQSTQEITIGVKEDYLTLDANNILTPNNDGVNDYLVIKNIDMYPSNTVKIFDRAGRMLYSKVKYENDWDGTFQGSPLAEDTYFYIVDFGPGIQKIKGFVTIVR